MTRESASLAAFLLGLAASCADEKPVAAPGDPRASGASVVLITLDTTRADRLGCYGNERVDTPHLDRLAREGIRYERAFTPIPSTLPSHASILTGAYPARHGVHDNGVYALDEGWTTLAERLGGSGYRTAAFVSAFVLDRQFGLAQGFEVYDDQMVAPLIARDVEALRAAGDLSDDQKKWFLQQASPFQRRAEDVTRPALEWIERLTEEPFFLWVHYFDAHMGYQPPSPFDQKYDPLYSGQLDGDMQTWYRVAAQQGWRRKADAPAAEMEHMIALYDGELAYMDGWIGKLMAELEARGRWDETLIVVVGDHGEGFGEHEQMWEHNGDIFDEVMRVPLILKLPGGEGAGTVVERLVRTIDVAPTILEVADRAGWEGMQGAPLMRADDAAPEPREILMEALREEQAIEAGFSWLGLRGEEHKLVLLLGGSGGEVLQTGLFDLSGDPGERFGLQESERERAESWTRRARELYAGMKAAAGSGALRGMDEVTSEALDALGYTGRE